MDLEVTVTYFLQFYINGEIGSKTGSIEKNFLAKMRIFYFELDEQKINSSSLFPELNNTKQSFSGKS